jgi:hypothetical protein
VEREQCGHDRERGPEQDGSTVTAPRADDRQRDGGEGGRQSGQADAVEMHAAAEGDVLTTEEMARCRRKGRERSAHDEDRGEPVARTTPHVYE